MLSELDELDSSAGWVPYFQKLNWIAKENAGPQKISKLPENRLFNRYRDVLPFDHSRVVLKEGDTDYINANLVEVPSVNRRYILTQGPLKNTATHFWQMVWEQKTEAIIMLNRVIEKNQLKCHQYWPCGEKVGHTDVLEFGCFRITYIEENMSEFFTVRKLEIFNMKEEEKRNVFHFHYLHWPDFGVPTSPATFLSFLFEARNAGVLSSDVGPSVIHCSAGIGRSGTFIMVDSILKEVEQTRDLNGVDVKTALLGIRRYRVGLIQTPDQLRFTYAAILEGTHMLMPEVYEEALDKFLNEREPEEDEVPPPVPERKRPEVDQTVDNEANIPPKRKRSLPDIPTESTSDAAETPKETSAVATPRASKDVSYQGFQADNLSSDGSDGEDEIIDLSASSSASSEQSEEDGERLDTKEEPTEHEKYTKESEGQGLRGNSKENEEEDSIQTETSHKTEEENIEMEEEEELQAEIEVQKDFSKIEGETTQEVEKATMERERAAETIVPRKAMESRMVEREEFHDKLEDKEEFAKTTQETAKSGKAKTKEVRKEGKRIDAGQSRAVSKETESRMREKEDLDRLKDREEFAKATKLKRDKEARKEREKKIDTGKSRPVSKEMESGMGKTEGLGRLKDREEFAKAKEVTAKRDEEARKEREKKIDTGKSRPVSKEMESGMGKTEGLGRLKDNEEFAKAKEVTARRDREATKERERKIDTGKSRLLSKEKESRMGETEALHDKRKGREEFAKTTEETPKRGKTKDIEVRKEREKKMDTRQSRFVSKEMETRMEETEKPSEKMKYREDFTEMRKETPQKMEREKVMGTEIAIQTSIPYMEEVVKMDVDNEQPSTEVEVELISKESIGIQACALDSEDITVVIDRNGDRKIEGKEKPSSKKEDFVEEYKEKELISKEKVDRIPGKEEVKELITAAVETGSSVEQQSVSKRQKIVDKSEKLVKTEDKLRKPLTEAGKITLTGPALVLEKMNAIKIQERVVSKPAPQPMESGSDIMESGHGAYARVTMAEKSVRSRDEPSIESIGGSIGTNPRKSETEIQSKEQELDKKVTQIKSPDDNPQPSTSKERATELRRRQRQEKKEKTEKLVKDIKDRVQHEESTRWIRKIIKNSLIVIGVCAAAYIAYRCYRYFYRIPRKFRRF